MKGSGVDGKDSGILPVPDLSVTGNLQGILTSSELTREVLECCADPRSCNQNSPGCAKDGFRVLSVYGKAEEPLTQKKEYLDLQRECFPWELFEMARS